MSSHEWLWQRMAEVWRLIWGPANVFYLQYPTISQSLAWAHTYVREWQELPSVDLDRESSRSLLKIQPTTLWKYHNLDHLGLDPAGRRGQSMGEPGGKFLPSSLLPAQEFGQPRFLLPLLSDTILFENVPMLLAYAENSSPLPSDQVTHLIKTVLPLHWFIAFWYYALFEHVLITSYAGQWPKNHCSVWKLFLRSLLDVKDQNRQICQKVTVFFPPQLSER